MGEVAVLLFPATDGAGLVAMPREAHGPVGAWRYSLYPKCLLLDFYINFDPLSY
jgi:hypothetical protein